MPRPRRRRLKRLRRKARPRAGATVTLGYRVSADGSIYLTFNGATVHSVGPGWTPYVAIQRAKE